MNSDRYMIETSRYIHLNPVRANMVKCRKIEKEQATMVVVQDMNTEVLYIWLNKINGIEPILASNLIEYFNDISEVYHADMSELLKVNGIGEKLAKIIVNNKNLDESERIIG